MARIEFSPEELGEGLSAYGANITDSEIHLYKKNKLLNSAQNLLGTAVTEEELKRFEKSLANRALVEEMKKQYGANITDAEIQRYKEMKLLEEARRLNGNVMTEDEFKRFKEMYGK